MNRDELAGKGQRIKGQVKRAVGKATDDERLRNEGEGDEAAGRVREGVGKARRKVGQAVEKIGKRIKR